MPHEGQTGVYFDSGGYRLLGTLWMAKGDDPKPTAVILHGLPGIEKNFDLALRLRDQGWNSLIFHYRGCWGSDGLYTFQTIPDDVFAALDYLSSGAHPQVNPERLYLIGHSMGGWAAIMAGHDPRVRAVAIIGAVCDPRPLDWGDAVIEAEFTPWLPGLSLDAFKAQWAGLDADYSPVEQVGRLAPHPLLILHGGKDEVVPVVQSEELHARSKDFSELEIHPAANHSFTWHRPWLLDRVLGWLQAVDRSR